MVGIHGWARRVGRWFPCLALTVLLCGIRLLIGCAAEAAGLPPRDTSNYKAGFVMREYTPTARRNWRGAEAHRLRVLVWYPAAVTANEVQQVVGPPDAPLFLAGMAAPHAAFGPSLGGLPVILLSPEAGDSAEQMAWMGTALARAGYLAVAVDHPGDNAHEARTAEGYALWWERATDLSEALDGLLVDPEMGKRIDRERVGVAGFGKGGYTALELGGAQTDISALYDRCKGKGDTAACNVPEQLGGGTPEQVLEKVRGTSGESLARSGDSFRDPRIRAVFALAPALGFTLTPESLRAMRLPVDVVVGSADAVTPAAENADLVHRAVRGARETVLPGVGHATFLDVCGAAGRQAEPQRCGDGSGVDREAVHGQVSAMAVTFFDRALR